MKLRIAYFISLQVGILAMAVTPLAAGDLSAGKARAQAVCQTCHGMDGQATLVNTANLSGQQKEYLVAQLKAFRSGGRHHEQMSIIAKMLSDTDIDNVAEWYSSIKVTVELPD